MKRHPVLNLPNILTMARIAAVPAMVVLLWENPTSLELAISWVVFVTAMNENEL